MAHKNPERRNKVFLVGDHEETLLQFQEMAKQQLQMHPPIVDRGCLLNDFSRNDVRVNKFIFVIEFSSRLIVFDRTHPARSFHQQIEWADQRPKEDRVLIVVYTDQQTPDGKLCADAVEKKFTSSGQEELQRYAERNRVFSLNESSGKLNQTQQKELKGFCLHLDSRVDVEDDSNEAKEKYLHDVEKLIKSKDADLHLQVGDKSIGVCKAFLCARSEEFHKKIAELKKSQTERETDVLVLENTTIEAVHATIHWLFTLKLPDDCSDNMLMLDIWALADKYNEILLKKECERRMIRNISIENVVATLIKADEVHCPAVKACFKFTVDNLSLVRKRSEMERLSHAQLLEIIQTVNLGQPK